MVEGKNPKTTKSTSPTKRARLLDKASADVKQLELTNGEPDSSGELALRAGQELAIHDAGLVGGTVDIRGKSAATAITEENSSELFTRKDAHLVKEDIMNTNQERLHTSKVNTEEKLGQALAEAMQKAEVENNLAQESVRNLRQEAGVQLEPLNNS